MKPLDENDQNNPILSHYIHIWGEPYRRFTFRNSDERVPSVIYVYEFVWKLDAHLFVYATIGASKKTMNHPEGQNARMELYVLANERNDNLPESVMALALYPFIHGTYFDEGHLVRGSEEGFVNDSPLTEILIARGKFEEANDYIIHDDKSHTHLFWMIPIYQSERKFASQNGWKSLRKLFVQQQVDLLDFFRPAAV